MNWRVQAACAGHQGDGCPCTEGLPCGAWQLFDACVDRPDVGWWQRRTVDEAKAMCRTCPVALPCLTEAMEMREETYRAGTTPNARSYHGGPAQSRTSPSAKYGLT